MEWSCATLDKEGRAELQVIRLELCSPLLEQQGGWSSATLAERITQVLHSLIFRARRSALLMGDPSITEILGRFFRRYHSLYTILVMVIVVVVDIYFDLLRKFVFPRITTCLRSL